MVFKLVSERRGEHVHEYSLLNKRQDKPCTAEEQSGEDEK